jgi:D-hexose-6-phosphate mutarotase
MRRMDALQPRWLRSRHGDVCVFAHGGHVAEWIPHGQPPVLWLSAGNRLAPGSPIRGGVPVIFPWFGDDPEQRGRPAHGFARRLPWHCTQLTSTRAVCELGDDDATRAAWPHAFLLRIEVDVAESLAIQLTVSNRDRAPFVCEPALHTYFAVGDVRLATVHGLDGTTMLDKVDGMRRKVQPAQPIGFSGEVDRVHLDSPATCRIEDPVLARRIEIATFDARSTIVWNPGPEKGPRMSDVGTAWRQFVCVESGNVADDRWTLPAGAERTLRVRFSTSPLHG